MPDAFWISSAAALGAVIGSFLNVCIYRFPRRCMTIARPKHSRCPNCGHDIRWYENIPVLSWLALRGRCSGCGDPISAIYPFVEALTALLFAMAAKSALEPHPGWAADAVGFGVWGNAAAGPTPAMRAAWFAVAAAFGSALIVATFVDLEFQIIPDQVSVAGAWLAPAVSLVAPWLHRPILRLQPWIDPGPVLAWGPHAEALLAALIGAAAGAGGIWLVGFLGKLVFRKEAMGFGDVKLMALIGGLLGWKAAILVFMMACILGSVVGVAGLVAQKLAAMVRKDGEKFDHYLAFGPYLAVAALAMFFWYPQIDEFVFKTYPEITKGFGQLLFPEAGPPKR